MPTTADLTGVSDLVRKCYGAYVNKDRQSIDELVGDPFSFTSPLDDHIDRRAYFERCWPNSESLKAITLEAIFEQGRAAFVRYRAQTHAGKEFRNTEYLRFEGDKLVEVDVYFGRTLKEGS